MDSAVLPLNKVFTVYFALDDNQVMMFMIHDTLGYIFDSGVATARILSNYGEQLLFVSDPWYPQANAEIKNFVVASN